VITTLEGVTDTNPDGKNRQEIIAQCSEGEMVKLVTYPQHPEDNAFIGVFDKAGNQIGHIDPKLARYSYLSHDMDHGCKVWARILEITGDPSHYDCLIEIAREEMDWKKAEKFDKKLNEARDARKMAYSLESSDPEYAALLFKECIELLHEFDQLCEEKNIPTWRHISHPINELTRTLEKQERYEECLEEIEKYEQMQDEVGLGKTSAEGIRKRKNRILKKLS
jgi:hypothetical protein